MKQISTILLYNTRLPLVEQLNLNNFNLKILKNVYIFKKIIIK